MGRRHRTESHTLRYRIPSTETVGRSASLTIEAGAQLPGRRAARPRGREETEMEKTVATAIVKIVRLEGYVLEARHGGEVADVSHLEVRLEVARAERDRLDEARDGSIV